MDPNTNPATLDPIYLALGENIRSDQLDTSRRDGAVKVYQASDASGGKSFPDNVSYGTLPVPLIPQGGFAMNFHFVATRPAASETRFLWSSYQSVAFATYVINATLTYQGLLTVTVMWSDTTTSSVSTTLSAGGTTHGLLAFDPIAATLVLYINNQVASTVSGLDPTLQPYQSIAYPWYLGIKFNPTVGVVADTGFRSAMDAFTMFSFKGARVSTGAATATLVFALRAHSARQWPNPMEDMVLFNYDMDGASATVLSDSSRFKNNGTMTGSPVNTAAVAIASRNANFIGTFQTSAGAKYNIFGNYGRLFYQQRRAAAS